MDLNRSTVAELVRLTLTRPRDAAADLIARNIPDNARWLGFALVVVLSVFMGQASVLMMGDGGIGGGTIFMTMFQASILLGMVVGVHVIGRLAGGTGNFPDAMLLVAWLQFVMVLFQGIQLVTLVILPPFFGLVTVLALGVFIWLLANFVAALHGFQSLARVAVGIILAFFGVAMVLAVLLSVLGLQLGEV